MQSNPASVYLASEVATIPRLKLVRMVYGGAIDALTTALVKLDRGERSAFVKSVSKAQNLIAELQMALDHEQGGEIARNLERLYEWIQRTLTPACLQTDRKSVEHVIELLSTLKTAWDGIRDDVTRELSQQPA